MSNTLKILVIEDNPGDTALLEYMLVEAGTSFELQCVERLSAGIEQAREQKFDVILLDLGLPDSYGLDSLIKLLGVELTAPVIVLTGLADETVGSEAVKAGAQDYLIKGQIDNALLLRSINYAIERKRTAGELACAAREWQTSFDAMADGVSIHSSDFTVIKANKSLLELLGKTSDEIVGKHCCQVMHGLQCTITDCPMSKAKDKCQKVYAEIFEPFLNKWLSITVSPVFDGSGELNKFVHTIRDITEHRKLEEQLRQSQKMESVGTLAGGIAHDFNNILTAILGYAQISLMQMKADDPLLHNIENILEAADRAASLTRELLLFSRKQPIERRQVDLNEVVAKVEKFLTKVIGEDIVYNTFLSGAMLPVLADKHQLEQVLMNLATNARDSMPNGGTFSVATELVSLDSEYFAVYGGGKPGVYTLMTVADTGVGMDEATKQRIFEPFFTTKDVGKGTGLGMAVVYGIIKQHDGFINVYSEQGMGTTFKIYLPAVTAVVAKEPQPMVEEIAGGTETILLAEDDDLVRRLESSVLAAAGYTVIEAVDGEDAVNKFKEHGASIDLLLLDLIMPKMKGAEAFEAIRKDNPKVKVLFSSGYSADILHTKVHLAAGGQLIAKPVSPTELLLNVRMMLDKKQ